MAYTKTANAEATPDWSPDGFGNKIYNEEFYGENAYDKDVDRYRERGAAKIPAVTLDQGQADQSRADSLNARGMQMGSLGMLENAARGSAPSEAAFAGQRGTSAALAQGMQASAARGGPGAQIAAMRNASQAAGASMGQVAEGVGNQAAKEGATNRGAFAGGANAMRGQDSALRAGDLNASTANAQLEAQNRALNEQRQQANERMAFDTRRFQEGATREYMRQAQQAEERRRANAAARETDEWNKVMGAVSLTTSAGSSAAQMGTTSQGTAQAGGTGGPSPDDRRDIETSDERAKRNAVPMGSLGRLMGGR